MIIQTLRGYFLLSSSSISIERFFGTSTRFVRSAVAVRYHESRDQSKGSPIELPPNTKGIAVRFLKQKLIFGFVLEILPSIILVKIRLRTFNFMEVIFTY